MTDRYLSLDAWIKYYEIKRNKRDEDNLRDFNPYQKAQYNALDLIINDLLRDHNIIKLWSAGSGIDQVSLKLKLKYKDNIAITLSDISLVCTDFNDKLFKKNNLNVKLINEDLFKSEHDNEFDIITNTGLLEHFDFKDQEKLIEIFSRALVIGGKCVILVPNSKANIYMKCMRVMKKKGKWPYGPEHPITSLKQLPVKSIILEEEIEVAAVSQLAMLFEQIPFLHYFFTPMTYLLFKYDEYIESVAIKTFGGYCLLGKFVKMK